MRLETSLKHVGCIVALSAVAACAPTSGRIVYTELSTATWSDDKAVEAAEAGAIPINIPHTRIVVARIDHVEGTRLPEGAMPIVVPYEVRGSNGEPRRDSLKFYGLTSAVPIESNRILSMKPRRTFTDRTDLKVSYFEGTLIPKSVGTETVDLVRTRIQQIGSAVTAILPVVGGIVPASPASGTPAKPPTPFDSFVVDIKFSTDVDQPDDGVEANEKRTYPKNIPSRPDDDDWKLKINWIDKRPLSTENDPTTIVYGKNKGLFSPERDRGFYPATVCRDAMVTISFGPNTVYTSIVRIADPERVRLVPLPAKGSLNFHGVCGVDMVDGTRAEPDHLGTIEALFKQAALIKGAMPKEKTPPASGTPTQ
jgi:hypothetical protein